MYECMNEWIKWMNHEMLSEWMKWMMFVFLSFWFCDCICVCWFLSHFDACFLWWRDRWCYELAWLLAWRSGWFKLCVGWSDVSLALEEPSLGWHLKFISILAVHIEVQRLAASTVEESATLAHIKLVALSIVGRQEVIDGLIDHISQQQKIFQLIQLGLLARLMLFEIRCWWKRWLATFDRRCIGRRLAIEDYTKTNGQREKIHFTMSFGKVLWNFCSKWRI